jgi:hypothetical protein
MVDGEAVTIIESGRLPNNWSAQTCELFALYQALKHLKEPKKGSYSLIQNMHFVWSHLQKILDGTGFNQQQGQDLVLGESIQQISSLKLPEEIVIVHVPGHQKGVNFKAQGNSFADETVKQAVLTPEVPVFCLILTFLLLPLPLSLPFLRRNNLKTLGAIRTEQRKWFLPDGREMISKSLMKGLLTYLHQGSQWGPQATCDAVLRAYGCIRIYIPTKQVSEGCLTCQKTNKQDLRQKPAGGRNPRLRLSKAFK